MNCTQCGAQLEQNAQTCTSCGASVATATPQAPIAPAAFQQTYPQSAPQPKQKSIAALVLGILSLFAWFIPLIGYPVTISGIIVSSIGLKGKKTFAVPGLILSIIGLVLSIINSVLGALLAVSEFLY